MNKRVLLINPPQENTVQAGVEDDFIDIIGQYPPLGLMYIGTVLQDNGFDVKILDCVPMDLTYRDLEDILLEFQPFYVGITTYTMSMVDVLLSAELVKKVDNGIKVILGGHHVQLYPYESISYSNVDYILSGEADFTFLELLQAIERKADITELQDISGVGFKNQGDVFFNKNSSQIKNLDKLPIPDRSLLPMKLYQSIVGRNKLVATVMSSRGCPYKCTFCYTPSKIYRSRSTENIIEEVKYLHEIGFNEVFFFDDLFALKPGKVIDFAQALMQENINIDWSFRGRINTVTEEMLEVAAKSKIHRIQFGIEAGVDKTLKRIRKGIDTKKIKQVIKWCRKYKISTIGNFMIGLPGETEEDINATLKFSRKIGLNYAQYSILVPYPFTAIYTEGLLKKVISVDYWLEFAKNPLTAKDVFKVQYWTETVSEQFLFETIKRSFKRFYFRPITVINKLKEIKNFQEFWFAVRGAFSVLIFNPKVKTIKGME